ncbi:endonuclease/exonuclease/phosphatase family protein [Caldilinea sp.]|uniref:endonuclease/exonuclease/phosphatase family protein n=1 Tax=Caldilinea sp. TaxID=2293560 RepID=UPI00261B8D30|nr:endonuclease/exonuclease/phosphatase family protein [uncultured Caldilinea sp.]
MKRRSLTLTTIALLLWLCFTSFSAAQPSEPIPVYVLQGEGTATPLRGRYVDALGVVTGVGSAGFYLQDPVGDGRGETSDGIYVYTRRRPDVRVGDCVLVRGALIDEFYDKTELSRVKAIEPSMLCRGRPTPAPLPTLPYAARPEEMYEPLEGMWVRAEALTGVVHGPTKRYASGEAEIALIPASLHPYISDGRIFFDEPVEQALLVYVSSALGAPLPDLHHGDRVRIAGLDGAAFDAILDYNFGKYQLLLLPGAIVERIHAAGAAPLPAAPAGGEDFTVCSYNLMALGGGSAQHPDPNDYARELHRRSLAIAEWLGGCLVIGLQESGTPRDAEALATHLRERFGLDYAASALPGPQTANPEFPLTNALLTRNDRVRVLSLASPQSCSPVDYGVVDPGACPAGTFPLFDRPPLVADLTVEGNWGDAMTLTVIVNHWKSKVGDEAVNLPRRIRQAQAVAELAQARLSANPNAAVIVLGDLNDYYGSEPVETVRTATEPDLVHLFDRLPPLSRYTYIYNGASQALDHVLVSPALAEIVGEATILRLSADYASPQAPTAADVLHASDHDPLLVRIWPRGVGWVAGNVGYPGVQVELLDAGGSRVAQAASDARGDFRLWNVRPGAYRLLLQAPPHVELSLSDVAITVISGENRFMTTARHQASAAGAAMALWSAAPASAP